VANARRLGFSEVLEARLVPSDDMSAYSVIGSDERFDVIFSNPPFALDLDAATNTATTDRGDLGLSIIDGLAAHLSPGGVALLYYDSNFYHGVMVRYARYRGYRVSHHVPGRLEPWEAATLYNAYLARFLRQQGIEPTAFRFDWKDDEVHLKDPEMRKRKEPPLLPGNSSRPYPGWIVIRRD
jgi:hypothetical protein